MIEMFSLLWLVSSLTSSSNPQTVHCPVCISLQTAPPPLLSPALKLSTHLTSSRDATHDIRVQKRIRCVLIRKNFPSVFIKRHETTVNLHDLKCLPVRHLHGWRAAPPPRLGGPCHREQRRARRHLRTDKLLLWLRRLLVVFGDARDIARPGVQYAGHAVIVEVTPDEGARFIVAALPPLRVALEALLPAVIPADVFQLDFAFLVSLRDR